MPSERPRPQQLHGLREIEGLIHEGVRGFRGAQVQPAGAHRISSDPLSRVVQHRHEELREGIRLRSVFISQRAQYANRRLVVTANERLDPIGRRGLGTRRARHKDRDSDKTEENPYRGAYHYPSNSEPPDSS
jgi:hypothetical protein